MSEISFKSPGFFDSETDASVPVLGGLSGVPASVIGTSNKGPAFVPVSVSNFDEFQGVFGSLDPKHYGPYAANEFLKNKSAFTYLRVLGAGSNITAGDILTTQTTGRVLNAGFKLNGNVATPDNRHNGSVQFLTAVHTVQSAEAFGFPMFTDNDSFSAAAGVKLLRGTVLLASGARMMVLDGNQSAIGAFTTNLDDAAAVTSGKFKLVISSTLGNEFFNADGNPGVRIFTASLDPSDQDYFAKILNTDPDKFVQEQHLLYADFAVDAEIATATTVAFVSGSANTSTDSGEQSTPMRQAYGAFDTRFKAPTTSFFISQPYGTTEYDLFRFEALDDGEFANKLYKISIANIKASLNDADPHGTFSVQIRDWNDTDTNPVILEQFSNCSLNPNSSNYVGKLIGDRKLFFNFDTTIDTERRLTATGKYPNQSKFVRVIISDQVDREMIPTTALPFGFRGAELLKTTISLTDASPSAATARLAGVLGSGVASALSGAILPPVPFRVKVTKGEVETAATWLGQPGPTEIASSQFYWGVKFERNTLPSNANIVSEKNALLESFTKFAGIQKLDVLVTGSGADNFNNNKFSLSRVALSNASVSDLTASVNDHMKEAAYFRNAHIDPTTYAVSDPVIGDRITFASLLANGTASDFNRFSSYTKFTNFMYGGFDGTNFLDRDARRLNDKASSFDLGGGAEQTYVAPGMLVNPAGSGQQNSAVISYVTALGIMTDAFAVNTNLIAIPGIRESFITDTAMKLTTDYGLALYVMDIPSYDDSQNRLFDDSTGKPSIDQVANMVDARGIDNNYTSTYYPDVYINDTQNKRRVLVPASVAAYGALGFNDRISYPWFAPAGFNRAALDFVTNVKVRLNVPDRDRLYESRINPIATFPKLGFVIYGQKTLQVDKSALDRVNVRRLLLEVKRIIIQIANDIVFEQNTPETRNKFVADSILQLGFIQAQAGIEKFQVVMNESNNTQQDVDLNRLNGKVIIVPTRTIEFIQMDFVITNSGVSFE